MAKVGLFDEMKNLLEHTKDITNEWDRLTAIECRVSSRLDAIQVEIVGLEKAIGFTSIPYEARAVIENQLKIKKGNANDLCVYLGKAKAYDLK